MYVGVCRMEADKKAQSNFVTMISITSSGFNKPAAWPLLRQRALL